LGFDTKYVLGNNITNFRGHNLAIIVMGNILFIGSYEINTNVIHLLVFFEHWCNLHCLDTNVICLFILFRLRCCVFIRVVYTHRGKKTWQGTQYQNMGWNSHVTIHWCVVTPPKFPWKLFMEQIFQSKYMFHEDQ
jgi:hypothetical protein